MVPYLESSLVRLEALPDLIHVEEIVAQISEALGVLGVGVTENLTCPDDSLLQVNGAGWAGKLR